MKIRRYTDNYKEQVIQLILNIQNIEFNIPINLQAQADLNDIPRFYQKEHGEFWLAILNETVVGTIALVDMGNQQVALRKMFVKKEFRGREFATASRLLDTAFRYCRNNNVSELFLGTTDRFIAAHRFYEKNGFEIVDKTNLPENFPIMEVDSKFYRFGFD